MAGLYFGAVPIQAATIPQTKLYFYLSEETPSTPIEPSPDTGDEGIFVPLTLLAICGTVPVLFFHTLKFND